MTIVIKNVCNVFMMYSCAFTVSSIVNTYIPLALIEYASSPTDRRLKCSPNGVITLVVVNHAVDKINSLDSIPLSGWQCRFYLHTAVVEPWLGPLP